jgi:hypothetical protein
MYAPYKQTVEIIGSFNVYQRVFGELDQVVVAANFSGQTQSLSIPLPQQRFWHLADGETFEAEAVHGRELEAYSAIVLLSGKS